jgi:hypothetical protein
MKSLIFIIHTSVQRSVRTLHTISLQTITKAERGCAGAESWCCSEPGLRES